MTEQEAIEQLQRGADDDSWEPDLDEICEIFEALYGRSPDDDEDGDLLSLCYAAIPPDA